jgi:hypothetical protein
MERDIINFILYSFINIIGLNIICYLFKDNKSKGGKCIYYGWLENMEYRKEGTFEIFGF